MSERRLQEVRRHLEKSGLDALLVSHLPHVRYLTGFSGSNGLAIITPREQWFLTDNRYRQQSRSEVVGFSIVVSSDTLLQAARKRGILHGKKRIGFEARATDQDAVYILHGHKATDIIRLHGSAV